MSSHRHSIHKNDLAHAMVARTEQASLAIARGNAPGQPFFVKSERDEH